LLVIEAAASLLLLIACLEDVRHRRIGNRLPAAVALAALLKWLAVGELAPALAAAGAAGSVFALFALCYCRAWVGGGDVKLASAAAFLLGAPATLPLLLLTALIGGILAVAALCSSRHRSVRPTLPYGVAIAMAAIALMALGRHGWMA